MCAAQSYLKGTVPASFFALEEALNEEKKSRNPPVMLWTVHMILFFNRGEELVSLKLTQSSKLHIVLKLT